MIFIDTQGNKARPKAVDLRFAELQKKQKESALAPEEQDELLSLVDQIEAAEAERLEHMVALSKLWNMTLGQLRERLGIQAPEPHVW